MGRSPGGRHGNAPQYSCLEDPHGQRSLADYSPWGCKELDTTEQLSIAQHTVEIIVVGVNNIIIVDNIIDSFLHSNIWNDSM